MMEKHHWNSHKKIIQENNTSKVIRVLKDLNIDTKMTSTFKANRYSHNKKEITKEFLLAIREKAPIDILHHMIDNGADINALDYSNWTPLSRAIENDQTELALLLIESGTEVNNCKPPQKLDYLKQNNFDKINQEHSCEKVSLVRNRLLRF